MASVLMRQHLPCSSNIRLLLPSSHIPCRNSSRVPKPKPVRGTIKNRNLIPPDCQSLADRGFLRNRKPYDPPADAEEKVNLILNEILGSTTAELSSENKFAVLRECFTKFSHDVPNSQLHKIKTASDVLKFYTTPVSTKSPYEKLQQMDLPPNLIIQPDYVRFNPETDTKFDGITAYPESPTVVTGLRSRKKYKGHSDRLPVHYYNDAYFRIDLH